MISRRLYMPIVMVVSVSVSVSGCLPSHSVNASSLKLNMPELGEDCYPSDSFANIADLIELDSQKNIHLNASKLGDVNSTAGGCMTLLMWSVYKGSKEGVDALLSLGADPNVYVDNYNSIRLAAIMSDSYYLKRLLQYGGSPNAVDPVTRRSILFDAAINGRLENIRVLNKYGANLDHKNVSGNTVLHDVISAKLFDVGILLVDLGADISIRNRWGYRPYDVLLKYGNKGVGAGPNAKYEDLKNRLEQELRKSKAESMG